MTSNVKFTQLSILLLITIISQLVLKGDTEPNISSLDSELDLICNCTVDPSPDLEVTKCGQQFAKIRSPDCTATSQSIVGGSDASPQAWPWQILTLSEVICGGTLIHPKYVLTAAHCTDKRNPKTIVAYAGFVKLDDVYDGKVWHSRVNGIIQHPEYNPETYENDVSILELRESAPLSHDINVICLPSAEEELKEATALYATGWGVIQNSSKEKNKTLQEVCLPYIDSKSCENEYYKGFPLNITSGMFCAGYPKGGKDSCQGDSGGPLSYLKENEWQVLGIVSWGVGCAEEGHPGVYTDVRKYLSFIQSAIKGNQTQ